MKAFEIITLSPCFLCYAESLVIKDLVNATAMKHSQISHWAKPTLPLQFPLCFIGLFYLYPSYQRSW